MKNNGNTESMKRRERTKTIISFFFFFDRKIGREGEEGKVVTQEGRTLDDWRDLAGQQNIMKYDDDDYDLQQTTTGIWEEISAA